MTLSGNGGVQIFLVGQNSRKNPCSRGDKIVKKQLLKYSFSVRLAPNKYKSIKMVKKRVRDPEVLADAPPAQVEGDDSGSDDVRPSIPIPNQAPTNHPAGC